MMDGAQQLLDLLRTGHPHRQVYRGRDGFWYVTYGGGQWDYCDVEELLQRGVIRPVYDDLPNECFHIGKTLNTKATIEERKKHRRKKDAPLIYLEN